MSVRKSGFEGLQIYFLRGFAPAAGEKSQQTFSRRRNQ